MKFVDLQDKCADVINECQRINSQREQMFNQIFKTNQFTGMFTLSPEEIKQKGEKNDR